VQQNTPNAFDDRETPAAAARGSCCSLEAARFSQAPAAAATWLQTLAPRFTPYTYTIKTSYAIKH